MTMLKNQLTNMPQVVDVATCGLFLYADCGEGVVKRD